MALWGRAGGRHPLPCTWAALTRSPGRQTACPSEAGPQGSSVPPHVLSRFSAVCWAPGEFLGTYCAPESGSAPTQSPSTPFGSPEGRGWTGTGQRTIRYGDDQSTSRKPSRRGDVQPGGSPEPGRGEQSPGRTLHSQGRAAGWCPPSSQSGPPLTPNSEHPWGGFKVGAQPHPRASASVGPDRTWGPALAKPRESLVLGLGPVEDPEASPAPARATCSPQSVLMGQPPTCPELSAHPTAGPWTVLVREDVLELPVSVSESHFLRDNVPQV